MRERSQGEEKDGRHPCGGVTSLNQGRDVRLLHWGMWRGWFQLMRNPSHLLRAYLLGNWIAVSKIPRIRQLYGRSTRNGPSFPGRIGHSMTTPQWRSTLHLKCHTMGRSGWAFAKTSNPAPPHSAPFVSRDEWGVSRLQLRRLSLAIRWQLMPSQWTSHRRSWRNFGSLAWGEWIRWRKIPIIPI